MKRKKKEYRLDRGFVEVLAKHLEMYANGETKLHSSWGGDVGNENRLLRLMGIPLKLKKRKWWFSRKKVRLVPTEWLSECTIWELVEVEEETPKEDQK